MANPTRSITDGSLGRGLLAVLGLLLALGGAVRAEDGDAVAKADALQKQGRTDEAAEVLREGLDAAKDAAARVPIEDRLASLHLDRGEPYPALQYLEGLEEDRGTAEDHLRLAEALLAVARQNAGGPGASSLEVTPYLLDAMDAAARAEGDAGVRARRRLLEGEVRWWQGDPEASLAAFDQVDASALSPERARQLAEMRAQALYQLERPAEAAEAFHQAGNLRGEAAAWAAARRPEETVKAYGEVLAQGPYDPTLVGEAVDAARFAGGAALLLPVLEGLQPPPQEQGNLDMARARLLEDVGRTDEAKVLLAEAAKAAPDDAVPLVELGRLRYGKGDDPKGVDQAVETWIQALQRDPTNPRAFSLLWDEAGRDYAAGWRSPHRLQRSIQAQEALTRAAPDDGLAWANLGNTLRTAGQQDEAVAAYRKAIEADPEDPGIVSDAGLALSGAGREDEALKAFEKAIAIDPDHDAAQQNAARVLWLRGDDAAATRHLARALQTARRTGSGALRYRSLMDRCWRTAHREALR